MRDMKKPNGQATCDIKLSSRNLKQCAKRTTTSIIRRNGTLGELLPLLRLFRAG